MRFSGILAAFLVVLPAGAADAATYVGTRIVDDHVVHLHFVTNRDRGRIGEEQMVDFRVVIEGRGERAVLRSPGFGGRADFSVNGLGFSATPEHLFFDFDIGFNALEVGERSAAGLLGNWALLSAEVDGGPLEAALIGFDRDDQRRVVQTDFQIIASRLVAVPEPQSWALLVGGFGLVGTALRRSRRLAAG